MKKLVMVLSLALLMSAPAYCMQTKEVPLGGPIYNGSRTVTIEDVPEDGEQSTWDQKKDEEFKKYLNIKKEEEAIQKQVKREIKEKRRKLKEEIKKNKEERAKIMKQKASTSNSTMPEAPGLPPELVQAATKALSDLPKMARGFGEALTKGAGEAVGPAVEGLSKVKWNQKSVRNFLNKLPQGCEEVTTPVVLAGLTVAKGAKAAISLGVYKKGDTPLMRFIRDGDLPLIELVAPLVEINAGNVKGETAWTVAAKWPKGPQRVQLLKLLLKNGANPDGKTTQELASLTGKGKEQDK